MFNVEKEDIILTIKKTMSEVNSLETFTITLFLFLDKYHLLNTLNPNVFQIYMYNVLNKREGGGGGLETCSNLYEMEWFIRYTNV